MKSSSYCLLAAAVLGLVMSVSCKKDEDDTKNYLSGTLKIESAMPSYVKAGEIYRLSASGVYADEDSTVNIAYSFTYGESDVKDTIKSEKYPRKYVDYTIPDTLATITITCVAFASNSSDYYSTSETMQFCVVNPELNEGSITNFSILPDEQEENLDGINYYVTEAGGLTWTRQNIRKVKHDKDGNLTYGHAYSASEDMLPIFGAYYTWNEAQTACPAGWRLPSDADFVKLFKAAGAPEDQQPLVESPSGAGNLMCWTYFNGDRMWEYYRYVSIKDGTRFSAMPCGFATVSDGSADYIGYATYAVFWTSDEYEGQGVYRSIYMENDNIYVGFSDKDKFLASVRCVRD